MTIMRVVSTMVILPLVMVIPLLLLLLIMPMVIIMMKIRDDDIKLGKTRWSHRRRRSRVASPAALPAACDGCGALPFPCGSETVDYVITLINLSFHLIIN